MLLVPNTYKEKDKTTKLKGQIVSAEYHKTLSQIAVLLRMPDGTSKSVVIHKSTLKFNGRKADQVSEEEIDVEMKKTAELFCRAKGRFISVELFENQL